MCMSGSIFQMTPIRKLLPVNFAGEEFAIPMYYSCHIAINLCDKIADDSES